MQNHVSQVPILFHIGDQFMDPTGGEQGCVTFGNLRGNLEARRIPIPYWPFLGSLNPRQRR